MSGRITGSCHRAERACFANRFTLLLGVTGLQRALESVSHAREQLQHYAPDLPLEAYTGCRYLLGGRIVLRYGGKSCKRPLSCTRQQ